MALSADDDRAIPPLGYCTDCIIDGKWMEARLLHMGTAYCAQCFLRRSGPGNAAKGKARDARTDGFMFVMDALRRGIHTTDKTSGF